MVSWNIWRGFAKPSSARGLSVYLHQFNSGLGVRSGIMFKVGVVILRLDTKS